MQRLWIACAVGLLIIVSMFVLQHHMGVLANEWAGLGVELTLFDRILMGVSAFWSHFGLLASPFILGACIAAAVISSFLWPAKS